MSIISWTPAGRKHFLEVLIPNIFKLKRQIKKHIFFVNTTNKQDIAYLEKICKEDSFFELRYKPIDKIAGLTAIGSAYEEILENTNDLYLRLDDDICFIERNLLDELIKSLEDNFFVSPFVVNNSICTFIYSHCFETFHEKNDYRCMDAFLWSNSETGTKMHELFFNGEIEKVKNLPNWLILPGERYSVNCFLMSGKTIDSIAGNIKNSKDEEDFLSSFAKENKYFVKIINKTHVCHFAYNRQNDLKNNQNLLSRYKSYDARFKYNRKIFL